jgi:hypothetical protein
MNYMVLVISFATSKSSLTSLASGDHIVATEYQTYTKHKPKVASIPANTDQELNATVQRVVPSSSAS